MLEIVSGVNRQQFRVAIRNEAMSFAFKFSAHCPIVGQLAIMDDGDVIVRIGPIGMGRADVDVGFRRHTRMTDSVRPFESTQTVMLSDTKKHRPNP